MHRKIQFIIIMVIQSFILVSALQASIDQEKEELINKTSQLVINEHHQHLEMAAALTKTSISQTSGLINTLKQAGILNELTGTSVCVFFHNLCGYDSSLRMHDGTMNPDNKEWYPFALTRSQTTMRSSGGVPFPSQVDEIKIMPTYIMADDHPLANSDSTTQFYTKVAELCEVKATVDLSCLVFREIYKIEEIGNSVQLQFMTNHPLITVTLKTNIASIMPFFAKGKGIFTHGASCTSSSKCLNQSARMLVPCPPPIEHVEAAPTLPVSKKRRKGSATRSA